MNYTSADFHLHYISSYILYVYSDTIYDSLVVIDSNNQVLRYLVYDNVAPTDEAIKLLSLPFQQVKITLPHQNLVWIPSEVYDQTERELYLDYFADAKVEDLSAVSVESIGATGIYQTDNLAIRRWKNLFPEATIQPIFELVLHKALEIIRADEQVMGVQIYDNQVDVYWFENHEMRLYNTFEVETVDDLSYFVLSVMKNFGVQNKIEKIVLSGRSLDSEWGIRLSSYTNNLSTLPEMENWKADDNSVESDVQVLNIFSKTTVCV